MRSLTSPFRRVGRVLAGHARRLQSALESLAGQVRAAIARIVGQATGEAMRDAVAAILDGPPVQPTRDEFREERERPWSSHAGPPGRTRLTTPTLRIPIPEIPTKNIPIRNAATCRPMMTNRISRDRQGRNRPEDGRRPWPRDARRRVGG